MRRLPSKIERALQTRDCNHYAAYENELQRIWPLNEKDREAKIAQFAKEYGFRLSTTKKDCVQSSINSQSGEHRKASRMRRMRAGATFLTEPGDSSATKWQPERVTIYEDMKTHWTPGEYDRRTEQLKKALESLRKQDEQLKRTTDVSPKPKAQKKTERVKRSDKRA